jgi:hypothetical protein
MISIPAVIYETVCKEHQTKSKGFSLLVPDRVLTLLLYTLWPETRDMI